MAKGRAEAARKAGKGRRGAASAAKAPKAAQARVAKRRRVAAGPSAAVQTAAAVEKAVTSIVKALPAAATAAKPKKKPRKKRKIVEPSFPVPVSKYPAFVRQTGREPHPYWTTRELGTVAKWATKYQTPLTFLSVFASAASVSQMDAFFTGRPLGANVEPSAIAMVGTLASAILVSRYYKKPQAKIITRMLYASSTGFLTGITVRAIQRRARGGGVSGTEDALPLEP